MTLLEAITLTGSTIMLDISPEAIKKVCRECDFPAMNHGSKALILKDDLPNGIVTVMGVAPCVLQSDECSQKCPYNKENGSALWLHSEERKERVFMFHPKKVKIKPL